MLLLVGGARGGALPRRDLAKVNGAGESKKHRVWTNTRAQPTVSVISPVVNPLLSTGVERETTENRKGLQKGRDAGTSN